MLFRLGDVADQEVGLAHVLVGAAVLGVELKSLFVVREGRVQVALIALRVAQQVGDVRARRVAQPRGVGAPGTWEKRRRVRVGAAQAAGLLSAVSPSSLGR